MHRGHSRTDATTRAAENVFRTEGHVWTVAYAGRIVHLKDAKGLHDIARLLARQDGGLPAAALLDANRELETEEAAERARAAVTMRIRAALTRIEKEHRALGRHLARSIRTGTVCRYDPEVLTQWAL